MSVREVNPPAPHDAPFEYVFPAIRGVQAKREYYVSMCPLRLLPKIFLFDEDELVPELRAQRRLNKARLPELSRYVLQNSETYTFSSITASIDGDVRFVPMAGTGDSYRLGSLHVSMSSKFVINDGQHRRAAIEMALRENPDLADESISVVFFQDRGLQRCQQMFADLNRHAIRVMTSLGVLYDHRDQMAQLAKLLTFKAEPFRNLVEVERSTLSPRSRRLFTLSALYHATVSLLADMHDEPFDAQAALAQDYWETVAAQFPEWRLVRDREMTAFEVRRDFIHSHGIVLQALGRVGSALLKGQTNWKVPLKKVHSLDWSRQNTRLWEGRAMIGGRVSKAGNNVVLTTNAIKTHLKLPLSPEERRVEESFLRGRNG
jgi:DNA sulfur modification protein DndB